MAPRVGARTVYESPRVAPKPGETVVTSTCGHNCAGRGVGNAHVRDGRIATISTAPRKWAPEMPPLHACVRGFGQMERVHHPARLLHPLRRVGSRGSGEFERIGWDEALDEVARQVLRVRDTYGPAAILDCSRTGSLSMLHSRATVQRLLHMFGGCTELWTNLSSQAELFAVGITYCAKADYKSAGREPIDYVNSRLIVMWGWSPADGTFGTGTLQYLKWAKKQGVRIVCVDPRLTRSSHELADEHVFIRPSTDAAALIAMAYVIASEGLQDQAYLDLHVLGFDDAHLPPGAPRGASYRSYLMGEADGIRKTPEWASAITGVPAETIRRLAIEFGTTKPAALHCGYAPDRTLRRRRAPRHHVLGAQRRPHAVGGRGPLRDLHEEGDRADRRVQERPRHLRRSRRPSGRAGLQREERGGVAPRPDAGRHRRLRRVSRARPGAIAGAGRCRRLREGDPRPRAPSVLDAFGQDRDLLDDAGGESRPVWPRHDPADPDVDSRRRRSASRRPASSPAPGHPEVAGADTLDPRQPADPQAGRPRRRVDPPGRRGRARDHRRSARARLQRSRRHRPARASNGPHRARRGLDQGRRLVHAGRVGSGHARMLQRADRRPRVTRGRGPVQHVLRRRRAERELSTALRS